MILYVTKYLFYVIIRVPLKLPTIRCNIQERIILKYGIISLGIMLPEVILSCIMCQPKINLQIYSQSHLVAVKRIFRYLVHTPRFELWYPKGYGFSLVGYTDSDWAGDKDDRKSTSEACQFLGRSLVCWSSKKQNCISLSTAEAEYVAAASGCTQLLWMRKTLKDYGVICDKVLFCVIMRVLSRLPTTRCNTQERSILRFVIILLEIMLPVEILN